ncbi:MAG: ferredoxin [Spirochaetes bacterium]|nr:MAG: ferredoxin [Spirochaetota bacterium]
MDQCRVVFQPQNKTVTVNRGTTLLEAAHAADITINNICGGDGICGRCKMIVKNGNINAKVSGKLTREEIQKSYVLACMAYILSDLEVEIPEETLATEKVVADTEAERFRVFQKRLAEREGFTSSPLVTKIYLELEKPTLENNTSDHQRVSDEVKKKLKYRSMQMGLKILRTLPQILRESNYRVTATVGLRRDIAEIMNIEGGNFENKNYMVVVDMGTTTIVAHLVDANTTDTLDAKACFNSGGIYGREVTGRMIMAEKKGVEELQRLLVEDINKLIEGLAKDNNISLKNITAVVCAGNTAMGHFLLGLPTDYIRRSPYVPTSTAPPPLRAAEVGIKICPRGLLYSLPGISGWVGSDITAGILATGMSEAEELSLLIDIGTNGEIIIGNKDWLISCSASAGPALEGASVECGMRAERGAIEKVYREGDEIKYVTIGDKPPRGLCGSGIIDLVAVLLDAGIINRSGLFVSDSSHRIAEENGIRRFILAERESSNGKEPIYITESDIENIITAKAAIFAATKILLERLELKFSDIMHFYIAGAFGNYIDVENAVAIGLIPPIPRERIKFVGNTSIEGAKMVAFYKEAFYKIEHIRENCTYYDLMGANDFVEEFQKALFLPHTDIELFRRGPAWLRA